MVCTTLRFVLFGMKDPSFDIDLLKWEERTFTQTKHKQDDASGSESENSTKCVDAVQIDRPNAN